MTRKSHPSHYLSLSRKSGFGVLVVLVVVLVGMAVQGSAAVSTADRSLDSSTVVPGGVVTATLTVAFDQDHSRVAIQDAYTGPIAIVTLDSVTVAGDDRDPLSATADTDSLSVTLTNINATEQITVRYTVSIKASAADGDSITFTGVNSGSDVVAGTDEANFGTDTATVSTSAGTNTTATSEWPMYSADAANTGHTTTTDLTANVTEKWSYLTDVGHSVDSSPAVVNGTVYVGSTDNTVYSLNASSGTLQWTFTTGSNVYASPAVANGTVYVGSTDNHLYALDADTGAEQWNYSAGANVWAPTIVEDTVYVGSGDENVYALNATTGAKQWNYSLGSDTVTAPAVANGTVYVASRANNELYALDADTGAKRWNFTTDFHLRSSPAVVNGTVYVGSVKLYAVDAVTGSEEWNYSTGAQIQSSPAVVDGTVYVGSLDSTMYAVDAATGTEDWTFSTGNGIASSPAVINDTVYVGSDDHKVYGLDAASGTEEWNFTTGSQVQSSPAVVDGVLYVGSQDGEIYALSGSTTPSQSTAANFSVTIGSTNDPVKTTESLNVTTTIENTGDQQGTQTISLVTNNSQRDAVTVTLASGATTTESLSWATDVNDAGGYTANVSTANDSATETVYVGDDTLRDGGTYYRGQELVTDAFAPGDTVVLRTGSGTFVTDVPVDDSGALVLRTGQRAEGSYTLTNDAGTSFTFDIVAQSLVVTPNQSVIDTTSGGSSIDFSVASNRGQYTLLVTSPQLDESTLSGIFSTGTSFDVDNDGVTDGLRFSSGTTHSLVADFESVASDDYTINFDVADTIANDTETITVEADGSDASSEDDHESPPRFAVSLDVTLPGGHTVPGTNSPIRAGEQLNVTAIVTNTGEAAATQTVTLVADGVQRDAISVSLAGGETNSSVALAWETGVGDAGNYTVTVSSDDTSDTAPVTITLLNASVSITNQTYGGAVVVDSAYLSDGGFLVIHDRESLLDGQAVDSVLGATAYLSLGRSTLVPVRIASSLSSASMVTVMAHRDTNDNQQFDFVSSNGSADVPYVVRGRVVTDDAFIQLPRTPTPQPPTPTASPTPSPTPTFTPTATPTPTPTPSLTADPTRIQASPQTATSSSDAPGFGFMVSLLAVVFSIGVILWRRTP